MVRDVRVHLLPALFEPEELRGGIAVIIDVLRASTVIVHALAHGAKCLVPCLTVEGARETARVLQPDRQVSTTKTEDVDGFVLHDVLLGGEREGLLIPGFDLDNNPFAYTEKAVKDKTIVFTTTNGTAALDRADSADRVLIGAFVNLRAVVGVLTQSDRPVHFVCAGTRGRISTEDVLCAGAMADRLAAAVNVSPDDWTDDPLQIARRLFQSVQNDAAQFRKMMRSSFGGRNCLRLGFDDQIDRAATLDLFDIVPEYDACSELIVRAKV